MGLACVLRCCVPQCCCCCCCCWCCGCCCLPLVWYIDGLSCAYMQESTNHMQVVAFFTSSKCRPLYKCNYYVILRVRTLRTNVSASVFSLHLHMLVPINRLKHMYATEGLLVFCLVFFLLCALEQYVRSLSRCSHPTTDKPYQIKYQIYFDSMCEVVRTFVISFSKTRGEAALAPRSGRSPSLG